MPKRVAVGTIIVQRDGKRMQVPRGQAFDFTAEELADINRLNPGAIRKVVNEDTPQTGTVVSKGKEKAPAAASDKTNDPAL